MASISNASALWCTCITLLSLKDSLSEIQGEDGRFPTVIGARYSNIPFRRHLYLGFTPF